MNAGHFRNGDQGMLARANLLLVALLISAFVVIVAQAISPYGSYQQQREPHLNERSNISQKTPNDAAPSHSGVQIECDPNCAAKESQDHRSDGWIARFVRKSIDDPLATFTGVLALAHRTRLPIGTPRKARV